jgi:hypothetical protein
LAIYIFSFPADLVSFISSSSWTMSIGNLLNLAVLLVFEVWMLPRMEMFYKGLLIELYPRESKLDEPL